jgi:arylsulfatase A
MMAALGTCNIIAIVLVLITALIRSTSAIRPNIVIMHLDDVGYGDLSFYSQTISKGLFNSKTHSLSPNIDRLAEEGVAFSSYYSSACVCSPSRAGLLTGRYPIRTSVFPNALSPQDTIGLPFEETTLASWLRSEAQYQTFMVGKWHLGHLPIYLPQNHGFDKWSGMPYSQDYCPCPSSLTNTLDDHCRDSDPPCPLMNGSLIFQQPAILGDLANYYADAFIEFIGEAVAVGTPFFGYYACQHTHHPQYAALENVGISARLGGRPDAYGDSVVEMDMAIGKIIDYIESSNLTSNTYVFLASDNGGATIYGSLSGDNSPLRCGKGTTWEGGLRVPFIVWGANVFKNVISNEIVAGIDIFATVCRLAQVSIAGLPKPLDGIDFSPLITPNEQIQQPRTSFVLYWLDGDASAVRVGSYKVHFQTSVWISIYANPLCLPKHVKEGIQKKPLVYDLDNDIGENYPLNVNEDEYAIQLRNARDVLAALQCDSLAQSTCHATPAYHCYNNVKEAGRIPPIPPKPFVNWEQTFRPCCALGYDIVVPNLENVTDYTCASLPTPACSRATQRLPDFGTSLCNPGHFLFPDCQGFAVCEDSSGNFACGTSSSPLECPPGYVIKYCPQGYFQCGQPLGVTTGAICTTKLGTCSNYAYFPRSCARCGSPASRIKKLHG